ncbi:MAG: hypothetical protein ABL932_19380, partial [Terricaulis sp.]
MAMDAVGFGRRIALSKSTKFKPSDVARALLAQGVKPHLLTEAFDAPGAEALVAAAETGKLRWAKHAELDQRASLYAQALSNKPYVEWLDLADRAEQLDQDKLYVPIWSTVNAHLGTEARSIPDLVGQLGVARFARRPIVGDSFCGGGSIPFEAARLGCDVVASDLNPIACMLTWGALKVVGSVPDTRARLEATQKEVAAAVDAEITALSIEHNSRGDRAKAYLYCLETRCPQTGYLVPLLPSRIISRARKTIAVLEPDHAAKRFAIRVCAECTDADLADAETGTVKGGDLVVTLDGETHRTPIKTIRGDRKDASGGAINSLRFWEQQDFIPAPNDIFQERLYAIQWITRETVGASRQDTYFASVTADDLAREERVVEIVRKNLAVWQEQGLVPDMRIEPGQNTRQPVWERGWTHWHHLFGARQLHLLAIYGRLARERPDEIEAGLQAILLARALNNNARLCRWLAAQLDAKGKPLHGDQIKEVFYNQALNTMLNWGQRSSVYQNTEDPAFSALPGHGIVVPSNAGQLPSDASIWITDPPYADAVRYEEITEFFIAWLRKNPPAPFKDWVWDSRRALAIKGTGESFKSEMITAYKNLAV